VGGDHGPLGAGVTSLEELVRVELGPTAWIDVPQARIEAFAEATEDRQWIHKDPDRVVGGSVRDHDRARLPHALAVRSDAVRALSGVGHDPRQLLRS
jgi:hypothetical protein